MEFTDKDGNLKTNTEVKCKGITLCDIAGKCINFESMARLVVSNVAELHSCYQRGDANTSYIRTPQIQFHSDKHGVMIATIYKKLNFSYRKRWICRYKNNLKRRYQTRPFGYKNSPESEPEEEAD